MIWAKTDAGRLEMQSRLHVRERPRRNLLLLIDGVKSQESLLAGLVGITIADFEALRQLELIELVSSAAAPPIAPAPTPLSAPAALPTPAGAPTAPTVSQPSAATAPPAIDAAPAARPAAAPMQSTDPAPAAAEALDYAQFTAALTRLISTQLGLRGFVLTLAVEKASTIEELRDVAQRVLDLIRQRKGDAVADEGRKTLYGS